MQRYNIIFIYTCIIYICQPAYQPASLPACQPTSVIMPACKPASLPPFYIRLLQLLYLLCCLMPTVLLRTISVLRALRTIIL